MDNALHNLCLAAARDTLMHVAGASANSATLLRPSQALVADLGYDDAACTVLAEYQSKTTYQLLTHASHWAITAAELRDCTVWQVYRLTVQRTCGVELAENECCALLQAAQTVLRAGPH